jgi:hypothetical protein
MSVMAAMFLAAPPALAQAGAQVGVLTCKALPGGLNLLIHSTRNVACLFRGIDGMEERYKGETGIALGVDLQWKDEQTIAFTVLGAVSDVRPGAYALAGKYMGGKASAAAGIGLGAAALIGTGQKSFTLQPLAIENVYGLGVAGGLTYLYIEPDQA